MHTVIKVQPVFVELSAIVTSSRLIYCVARISHDKQDLSKHFPAPSEENFVLESGNTAVSTPISKRRYYILEIHLLLRIFFRIDKPDNLLSFLH